MDNDVDEPETKPRCRNGFAVALVLACVGIVCSFVNVKSTSRLVASVVPKDGVFDDDDDSSLNPLHICNVPEPFKGRNITNDFEDWNITYQCTGKTYKNFGQNLLKFADNTRKHGKHWGRRKFPLPANTTTLFMGNSHMRQITHGFICQYRHVVQSIDSIDTPLGVRHPRFWQERVVFANGATAYVFMNHPFAYSKNWAQLLEQSIQMPLQNLDAIVLGKFNGYKESSKTTYARLMNQFAAQLESISFEHVLPPMVADVAFRYDGPIVATSMMAAYVEKKHARQTRQQVAALQQQQQRNNVRYVDARKYVKLLGECGCLVQDKIRTSGVCTNRKKGRNYHRCMGQYGGHPDLVAWDVLETIYALVSPKKSR